MDKTKYKSYKACCLVMIVFVGLLILELSRFYYFFKYLQYLSYIGESLTSNEIISGINAYYLDKTGNYVVFSINLFQDLGIIALYLVIIALDVFIIRNFERIVEILEGSSSINATPIRQQLQNDFKAISGLMEQNKIDDAKAALTRIIANARQEKLNDIVRQSEQRLQNIQMLEQLNNMVSVSERLKIDDVSSVLKMPRVTLMTTLVSAAKTMKFKIAGDEIIVPQDNVSGFLAALDQQFATWSGNESAKNGKI